MVPKLADTFYYIPDDQFLSMVGSISAVFNCSGRLLYGFIMDKTSYRIGMSIEAVLLTLLVSTFYLTSLVGTGGSSAEATAAAIMSENACRKLQYFLGPSPNGLNVQNIRYD